MELKKLIWKKIYSSFKDYDSLYAKFPFMESSLKISIYYSLDKNEKRMVGSEKFYLNKVDIPRRNGYFSDSRRIQCDSLEDAKEKANNMCLEWISKTYCEKPVSRRVLVEKKKKKISRKKIEPVDVDAFRHFDNEEIVEYSNCIWGVSNLV